VRLATLRRGDTTVAARIDETSPGSGRGAAVEIDGAADLGQLLADPAWRDRAARAHGERLPLDALPDDAWAPLIPRPSKIICVGLNYREHILEMGRELPEHPTLFAKFAEALIGAHDDILVPVHASSAVDWEAELAVVIGAPARHIDAEEAVAVIAGYSVLNDVSMRDYQNRTLQWLQGKTFESTCPFGPVLVTSDEYDELASTAPPEVATWVNGDRMQHARADDLVFGPAALIAYISSIITLNPGDVIATGTPWGVGHGRPVPLSLRAGDLLRTGITGIGTLENTVTVV
jgi:acylpyruvate hydrolase